MVKMRHIACSFITSLCVFIGFIHVAHAAECNSMEDVFSSEKLNSYLVVNKTYFLKKCENDEGLCETRQYVIPGDYLLAGFHGDNLCAAYMPETHETPRAIGWIHNNGNIKITEASEYESISGAWFSNNRPIYKTIDITITGDKVEIDGDLFSRTSNRINYLEGDVFKISREKYIIMNGDCKGVISNEKRQKLTYISNCDDDFFPFVFAGDYSRDANGSEVECNSIDDIFWARRFASYAIRNKTYFWEDCEEEGRLCKTSKYVVPGDYVLAAFHGEKLCAAYMDKTYTQPRLLGWLKSDDADKLDDEADYAELSGEWQSNDRETTKMIHIETFDADASESNAYLRGKISSQSDAQFFDIEGYIYKSGDGRYVFANNGSCRMDVTFENGVLELNDWATCYHDGALTASGHYMKQSVE